MQKMSVTSKAYVSHPVRKAQQTPSPVNGTRFKLRNTVGFQDTKEKGLERIKEKQIGNKG